MVLHSSLLIVQSSRVHPIADGSRCGKCEQTTVTTSRLVLHVHVLYCDGLPTEKHYICHPRTASSVHCMPAGDALREVVDSFKREYGFPQCAGAVDGTHIPTVSPIECPGDYYNHIVWVFFNAKVIWTWSLKYSGHHLHHSLFVLHVFTPPLLFIPAYFLCPPAGAYEYTSTHECMGVFIVYFLRCGDEASVHPIIMYITYVHGCHT